MAGLFRCFPFEDSRLFSNRRWENIPLEELEAVASRLPVGKEYQLIHWGVISIILKNDGGKPVVHIQRLSGAGKTVPSP